MDVILLDYIDKVGDKHDVVKVRDGFGRNYLIPKGLAIVANKTNLANLNGLKKQAAKKENAMLDTYRAFAAKLAGPIIQILSKAGESGRLFGSVTAQHLVDAIREERDVPVEKRMMEMPEEVKELGQYEAQVKFHPEVIATVKFEVVTEKKAVIRAPEAAAPAVEAVAAPVEIAAVEEAVIEVAETPVVEEAAAEAVEMATEAAETVEAAAEAVVEDVVEEPVAEVETAVEEIEVVAETAVEEIETATETATEEIETATEVVAEAADTEGSEEEVEKEA